MRVGYLYLLMKKGLQPFLYFFLKIDDVRKSAFLEPLRLSLFTRRKYLFTNSKDLGQVNTTLVVPKVDVWTEKEVQIIGDGVLLNKKSVVILESTIFQKEYLIKSSVIHKILLRKILRSTYFGSSINLANSLAGYYFHWNLEGLLRLAILDEDEINSKLIIVNQNSSSFVYSSLKLLFGVNSDRVIECQSNIIMSVEECLVVPFQHIRPELSMGKVNLYYPESIRRLAEKSRSVALKGETRNFVISRKNASQRKILDENRIVREFPNLNLEILELDGLSFESQINLFFNAGVVIAAHGAGLTNLIYAVSPNVIELFPENRLITDSFYFPQISEALNFNHVQILAESDGEFQNILVNDALIAKIEEVIRSF